MKILIDTHALFWFFSANKQLSKKAKITLENSEQIIVPTIVLLELLYLFQKKKQPKQFPFILNKIKHDSKYSIISLDIALVDETLKFSSRLEIHDAIIAASARLFNAVLITKDPLIQKVYPETVW